MRRRPRASAWGLAKNARLAPIWRPLTSPILAVEPGFFSSLLGDRRSHATARRVSTTHCELGDESEQNLRQAWLDEVRFASAGAHCRDVARAAPAAQEDDRDRARSRACTQTASNLETVEPIGAAEPDVEHDDVGRKDAGQGYRLVAIPRELDDHPFLCRDELIGEAAIRVVIDEQNADRARQA
jgi:hypothetical protein